MNSIDASILHTLEATGLPYEVKSCDPEYSDTSVFCAHYGYRIEDSANTILVKAKNAAFPFVVCVLLGHTRVDANHVLRKRLQARKVSFASPEETRDITGMELGGVTAFGLPADLPLWIDAEVMTRDCIILGSGQRAAKIFVPPAALLSLPTAEVVAGLAK